LIATSLLRALLGSLGYDGVVVMGVQLDQPVAISRSAGLERQSHGKPVHPKSPWWEEAQVVKFIVSVVVVVDVEVSVVVVGSTTVLVSVVTTLVVLSMVDVTVLVTVVVSVIVVVTGVVVVVETMTQLGLVLHVFGPAAADPSPPPNVNSTATNVAASPNEPSLLAVM